MNDPLDAEGVSKNTTPNAVREATQERLDHIYNCAVSQLRNNSEKTVLQMQESIRAIRYEWDRRERQNSENRAVRLTWIAALSAVAAVVSAIFTAIQALHTGR